MLLRSGLLNCERFNLLDDIYYSKDYVSLYLNEGDELLEFKYTEGDFLFYDIAIKRPILKIGNQEITDGYFDLETAYGYGGYLVNTDDKTFIERALKNYKNYCLDNKIIAQFIRFHPWNNFPKKQEFFDFIIHDRDVVIVDLSLSKEERWGKYSSNIRRILKKCEKEGLNFQKSTRIEDFIYLYYKTMDKNKAEKFYYFPKIYFDKLLKINGVELFEVKKEDTILSMAIFMFSKNIVYYHLGANNYDFKKYSAMSYLFENIFELSKKRGKRYVLLGGGRSSHKDDLLLKFKLKFSSLTKPYYVGGIIFNYEMYNKYIAIWEEQAKLKGNTKYFLKYRLEIN